jgi:hypothetical protein
LLYCGDDLFPLDVLSIIAVLIYRLKFTDCKNPRLLFNVSTMLHDSGGGLPIYKGYDNRTGAKVSVRRFPHVVTCLLGDEDAMQLLQYEANNVYNEFFSCCRESYSCEDSVYAVTDYFSFSLSELVAVLSRNSAGRYVFPERFVAFIARRLLACLLATKMLFRVTELRTSDVLIYPIGILLIPLKKIK